MKRPRRRSLHGAAIALVAALASEGAAAQSASARVLFAEGRKLASEGKYASACPKFEESYKTDPGMGTLFNLADCWEHLGRTASAWAAFLQVADAAARTRQVDREQIARARATAIVDRLPRLSVDVRANDPDLEISRDGVRVGAPQWGTPLPVDPGEHQVAAHASGKKAWEKTISVADGKTATVIVPPLDRAAPISTPAPPTRDADLERRVRVPALGWVLGGVGLAGIATGIAFGLRVIDKNREADSVCPSSAECSRETDEPAYTKAVADARSAQAASIVGFGAGGTALAAAVVVVLASVGPSATVQPHDATASQGAAPLRILPMATTSSVGASFGGTW